ncbi:Tvp38p KNAG_0C06520 [Huiozyma naganishii CBS 8797]|uniref:Golgi apparatus membrane protein TVP38 n=1 Tax=Huiozyma naganishii (strain ATCC MYA-139 / BCRC 22969 / CBS 8797 / KCTC 17520 / NBRC 10181 / NCYC 3082 / Yp74L-3) TaxID=1071383 RepID=J7R4G8_HUIN7|nr:hypothetical protein KNAG_0C06520 [Kazachstania naganishii CBS 8797]CCK69745.1 hypothetical protein KNAG_0C06520 [Kazachstania naganishii CBS 8797]
MSGQSNPFDDPAVDDNINEFNEALFNELNEDLELDNSLTGGPPEEHDMLDMYNLTPRQRFIYNVKKLGYHIVNEYGELSLWKKMLLTMCGAAMCVTGVLLLVYHNAVLVKLVEVSDELSSKKSTPFILCLLVFIVGFPPLIGFSFLSTSTGLIYGVSLHGWIILAIGSVGGSIASFALFKNILRSRAERLLHMNKRFEAFASVLQENNSYWLLALLRLCPFPYSLTNGAIASIYGISLKNFAIANVITSPKLLIYLFIGSRIKNMGETTSAGSRLFDFASILVTIAVFTLTAWLLYFRTQRRYREMSQTTTTAANQNNGTVSIEPDSFEI